jgi:hypothetical protein
LICQQLFKKNFQKYKLLCFLKLFKKIEKSC